MEKTANNLIPEPLRSEEQIKLRQHIHHVNVGSMDEEQLHHHLYFQLPYPIKWTSMREDDRLNYLVTRPHPFFVSSKVRIRLPAITSLISLINLPTKQFEVLIRKKKERPGLLLLSSRLVAAISISPEVKNSIPYLLSFFPLLPTIILARL